jgi:hypothetical protein
MAKAGANMTKKTILPFAFGFGVVLGAASLALLGFSLYYAERLPDWKLPGLAALVAIAANVMFMTADRIKRGV